MKKLYSLIAVMLMTVASAFANITINSNVGGVCTVYYSTYNSETYESKSYQLNLVEGENVITETDGLSYISMSLSDTSTYIFKSVKCNGSDVYMSSYTYVTVYGVTDGNVYDVTISTIADACDAKCTVKADDPSKVSVQTSNLYRTVSTSVEGTEFAFVSSIENSFSIRSNSNKNIYKILVDGVEQTVYSSTYVYPKDGSVIDIITEYPDVDCKVALNLSEGAEGVITKVTVDGTEVSDFANGFTAKMGSTVILTFDKTNYNIESVKINGTTQYVGYYGTVEFNVSAEENTIEVTAHKYGELSYTITVDDPSNVVAQTGDYSSGYTTLQLVAGENELKVSEQAPYLSLAAADGCYLTSVTLNGEEQLSEYSKSPRLYLSEGAVVNITSGKINRDQTFVVYINDKSLVSYLNLQNSERSNGYNVATGYTTIPFYSGDLPIYYYSYGATTDEVYLDDVAVEPVYSYSNNRQMYDVKDNSVIKIFFNETPATYTVTVDATEGIEVSATKDILTAVADCSSFTVLGSTQVDLTVSDEEASVLVNGEAVEAVNGVYTFTVAADTNVVVSSTTGVSNITVDGNNAFDVYNLQGIRVARNVNNLNNLPAGIYIANGKKVIVK